LFLFKKARASARLLGFATLLVCMVAGGVTAAFAAGQLAADATGAGTPHSLAATAPAPTRSAAMQHGAALAVSTAGIDPALLHAATYLTARHLPIADAGQSARELDCLTAAVYYESRGESAAGQAAVAQVVLNRVSHPLFPKSICGVVYQGAHGRGCQFSFACNGAMHARHEPAAWARARDVAERAMGGYVMTDVGRATHFHVTRLGAVWGGGMMKIARVGGHDFYTFSGRHTVGRAHGLEPAAPDTQPLGPPADGGVEATLIPVADKPAVAQAPAETTPTPAGS
jgi:spore germination cell wall hydrolase CwlJ-like protein